MPVQVNQAYAKDLDTPHYVLSSQIFAMSSIIIYTNMLNNPLFIKDLYPIPLRFAIRDSHSSLHLNITLNNQADDATSKLRATCALTH